MMKNYILTGFILMAGLTQTFSQCTTTNATTCVCAQSGVTNCDLLPDIIVARPPLLISGSSGVIEYSQTGNGSNNGRLRVSVSTPNIGHGPLEIRADTVYICGTDTFYGTAPATCPVSGLPPKQLINQRIYHKNGNTMTYYNRPAGSMTYHSTHGHMHVDDWGIYTLRTATVDPNPLNWPVVGTGAKLAFCLMDYGTCSGYAGHCVDSLGNTLLNTNFPNHGLGGGSYSCSPVFQGISSGYTDIYYQYLDGMYITIPPGTCNGNYYIVVQLDPYNYFLESNETNNVIAVPYTLTQQTGAVPVITANGPTVLCPGGSVMLTATQGNSYLWSNGATTQSITASTAGSYVVTVYNTNCTGTSLPTIVTINNLPVTSSVSSDTICNGANTQLNSVATTAGYTNLPTAFTNNTVVAIPDNNANGVTSSINVSGINPLSLVSSSVVSVTVNITHTYDGDLIISLISPSGNQVTLSNRRGGSGDNFNNTVFRMNAVTPIASGTAPFAGAYIPDGNFSSFTGNANGTWQLKVADVAGTDIGTINSWTLNINSQVPNAITYAWTSNPPGFTSAAQNPSVSPIVNTVYMVTATDVVTGCTGSSSVSVTVSDNPTATATSNTPVCAGNNINLNATASSGTFTWTGPNGYSASGPNPVISNASVSNDGVYTVTAVNAAGCTGTATVNVNVVSIPVISSVASNISCNGGSDGSVNLTLTNGSGASFLWSNGSTTEDLSGLPAGNYMVTVTKSACVVNANYILTEPTPILHVETVTQVTCIGGSNGSISVQASGGVPPYAYLWNNGQTTASISNLTSGTYQFTLTDANNCSVTGSVQVTQPVALVQSGVITKVSCSGANNGVINVSVSGGTPPYTYSWNNGTTTEDRSSLPVGYHNLNITDACGITSAKNYYVAQLSSPFGISISKTNIKCAGGSGGTVSATVINGIPPFSYLWNTVPAATTPSVSGLPAGTYTVTIGDASGCTKSASVTVTQPPNIVAVVTQTNVSTPGGNDGSISLAVTGGVGPYTYKWNTIPVQTTASVSGLVAGIYKCTIKDSKLCVKKVTVTITEPSPMKYTGNTTSKSGINYVNLSPNPSDGVVQLSFIAEFRGISGLEITDLLGNKIKSDKLSHVRGYNTRKLDLRGLPKGIYFVRIQYNGQTRVSKLILQ